MTPPLRPFGFGDCDAPPSALRIPHGLEEGGRRGSSLNELAEVVVLRDFDGVEIFLDGDGHDDAGGGSRREVGSGWPYGRPTHGERNSYLLLTASRLALPGTATTTASDEGILFLHLPRESGGGNWPGLQRHRPRQLPARPSPPARADPSPGIWRRVPDATSVDAPAKGIISAEMTAGRHAHLRFRAGRTDEGVWPSPVEHSDAGERSISIRHQTVFFPSK